MMKKQQKGSLLIEMMAIIGLLTLITPVLFQQVHRRNEEVVNAQIATEMRMVKDAVGAYLEARGDKIAQTECASASSVNCCKDGGLWEVQKDANNNVIYEGYINTGTGMVGCNLDRNAIKSFLAGSDYSHVANNVITSTILNEYQIDGFGYTVETNCTAEGSCEYRPVLFALIAEGTNSYSTDLRRKAKIASLIGAEGGVVQFSEKVVQGMQSSWNMPLGYTSINKTGASGKYAAAAVTFFNNIASSSVMKDVRWQHLKATTAQADTIVGNRMAATELFSVSGDTNCIQFQGAGPEVRPTAGAADNCQPLFEVNPTSRQVRISSEIRTGTQTAHQICANLKERECGLAQGCSWNATTHLCVNTSADPIDTSCGTIVGLNAQNRCIATPGCSWYGGGCRNCGYYTTLNANVRRSACESGGCAWISQYNSSNNQFVEQCVGEYMLDPEHRSILGDVAITKDITIASRGNRGVAASLPNSVLMGGDTGSSVGLTCWYNNGSHRVICSENTDNPSALGTRCLACGNNCPDDWTSSERVVDNVNNRIDVSYAKASCENIANFQQPDNWLDNQNTLCSGSAQDVCGTVNVIVNHTNTGCLFAMNKCIRPAQTVCNIWCNLLQNACGAGDECARAGAACVNRCAIEFPIGTEITNIAQLNNITEVALEGCYTSHGMCLLTAAERACPDRSYRHDIAFQVSNFLLMPSGPGPGITSECANNNCTWNLNLGGVAGVRFYEYCTFNQ